MDYSATFAISAAGMSLHRARVEVAAVNLANAHTTAPAGQPGFKPTRVVGVPAQQGSFPLLLAKVPGAFQKPSFRIEPQPVMPRLVHEPGHPLADGRGFVEYPGVDVATEMVTLMDATRAYEANVAAMNTARTLALKALEIGGNS